MKLKTLIWIPVLSLLAACASTPDQDGPNRSAARQTAEINTALGQEYMSRGQHEIALEKLKKASSADPTYAPAQTMLGVLYEQIGELASAEKHYQLAVQAAPANGDVNNNFGVFLCKSGRLDAAERHFQKAIEDPFYRTPAVALANAGSCLLQNGNLDKAEKYLRQSLEYDAEFPDALLPMASVSQQKGEHLRARAFLQRYQATGKESAASLALGVRIETSLDNQRAAQDYRDRLLRDHPDSPQAADVMSRVRS